ncbi:unnamed protein product, partial [Amoebophrya sp. A120]
SGLCSSFRAGGAGEEPEHTSAFYHAPHEAELDAGPAPSAGASWSFSAGLTQLWEHLTTTAISLSQDRTTTRNGGCTNGETKIPPIERGATAAPTTVPQHDDSGTARAAHLYRGCKNITSPPFISSGGSTSLPYNNHANSSPPGFSSTACSSGPRIPKDAKPVPVKLLALDHDYALEDVSDTPFPAVADERHPIPHDCPSSQDVAAGAAANAKHLGGGAGAACFSLQDQIVRGKDASEPRHIISPRPAVRPTTSATSTSTPSTNELQLLDVDENILVPKIAHDFLPPGADAMRFFNEIL